MYERILRYDPTHEIEGKSLAGGLWQKIRTGMAQSVRRRARVPATRDRSREAEHYRVRLDNCISRISDRNIAIGNHGNPSAQGVGVASAHQPAE